ncbi:class I SAM-dependent methyltransferase [Microlunatus speluncae]|uniref:class I SAM-dependent methyltransferase n=1 Tax=Microlunatus speluncae TaxID=2594267 RepID=UPI0012664382|nr:class I SAM-dependent methyltransferase [Microlunatus speluncae]
MCRAAETDGEAGRDRPAFPLRPEFAPDLFAGTAEYYAKYRDGYPEAMLDDIMITAGSPGDGTLLDLACGTGQVAIPMARRFTDVWAVDQEPDMIKVGAAAATRAGVGVRWTCGRAETLAVGDGELRMITIANAFHRLDRRPVARSARRWLSDGGTLVIMGSGRRPEDPRPEWELIIQRSVREWRRSASPPAPTSDQSPPGQRLISHEDLLAEEGFRVTHRSFVESRERSLDEVIGHVYSRSYASRRALGPKVDEFEAQLRRRLTDHQPNGRFAEDVGYFFSIGR